jgi:hypothetical protein
MAHAPLVVAWRLESCGFVGVAADEWEIKTGEPIQQFNGMHLLPKRHGRRVISGEFGRR